MYFTLNNGEYKGREYVRSRVRRVVSAATIAATIDNDEWMASRYGFTVAALVRDARYFQAVA